MKHKEIIKRVAEKTGENPVLVARVIGFFWTTVTGHCVRYYQKIEIPHMGYLVKSFRVRQREEKMYWFVYSKGKWYKWLKAKFKKKL